MIRVYGDFAGIATKEQKVDFIKAGVDWGLIETNNGYDFGFEFSEKEWEIYEEDFWEFINNWLAILSDDFKIEREGE